MTTTITTAKIITTAIAATVAVTGGTKHLGGTGAEVSTFADDDNNNSKDLLVTLSLYLYID